MEKILVTRSSMPPFEEYAEMIRPLWDSHWLTNMGDYHKQLEKELEEYLHTKHLSLTVNGHMALELAIQSMKFPEGSEIITTPFTFISTTHAIMRNNLKPVFCDIKRDDFTIDEEKIEELITPRTVAIVPVHVYGNICNIKKIQDIAFQYDLKVIYDAAHAFAEEYLGENIANFGDISVFSFHATKVFNTIEGGAVCCHTEGKWNQLYNLKNFGIRSEESVVSVGANAKMNEFQAAMGLCNLKHIDEEIQKRKIIVERYRSLLDRIKEVHLHFLDPDIKGNYAYLPALIDTAAHRDQLYNNLRRHGILSRKYFYPITADAACFKNQYKQVDLRNARDIAGRILVLPLFADMTEEQVNFVCQIIMQTFADREES